MRLSEPLVHSLLALLQGAPWVVGLLVFMHSYMAHPCPFATKSDSQLEAEPRKCLDQVVLALKSRRLQGTVMTRLDGFVCYFET